MATLREKLAARIEQEQAEIARIKAGAIEGVQVAQQRIDLLLRAQAALTPQLELLIDGLQKLGIKVLE